MLSIKISGATPIGGQPICHSCKNCNRVIGQNREEILVCEGGIFRSTSGRVTMRVATCGAYHPSNVPWLHEMEAMAWKVEARKRGPAGFSQPEENEMEVIISPPSNNGDKATPGPC
jgi:hypothetical protein